MKRFVTRLGRFFGSWRFLKIMLWTATIIVLFYVEEDWRGARAWAATKAKWEARGETFDLKKFEPPPVPAGENLGSLPLFQMEKVPGAKGQNSYLEPKALHVALRMRSFSANSDFPPPSHWVWGELQDPDRLRAAVAQRYAATFKTSPTNPDFRAQFEAIYPFLPDLRSAALDRPFCRFEFDETQVLPASRALELIVAQIMLTRLITLDAVLALEDHQPEVAMADYATILKLRQGVERDPSLVGALVSASMFSIAGNAVFDGLSHHAWTDAQLEKLDRLLASVDFLATYRFAMRSEAAVSVTNIDYFRNVRPRDLALVFNMTADSSVPLAGIYAFLDQDWREGYALWPRGWFDENKAMLADQILQLADRVDIQTRQVDPAGVVRFREAEAPSIASVMPWRVIATDVGPERWTALRQFSSEQVMVDEMRLACALERYWLKRHTYPSTLAELVPQEMAALPRDVMTGQDYRYRLRPDGTYLLYSIGWNGKDDGGSTVFNAVHKQNYERGDWVWPTPQKP